MGIGSINKQLYTACTDLVLSETRTSENDYGYYNYQKVQKIRRYLTDMGITTDFVQNRLNHNILHLIMEDLQININFGSNSREAEEADILWEAEKFKREGYEVEITEIRQREMKKGLVNKDIRIDLYTDHPTHIGDRLFVPLTDEKNFTRQIKQYSKAFERVISSFYLESGKQIPTEPMILQPFLKQTNK